MNGSNHPCLKISHRIGIREKIKKQKKKMFLTDPKVVQNGTTIELNSESETGYCFESWNRVKEVK